MRLIKDFLFPKVCVCGEVLPSGEGGGLCVSCWREIEFVSNSACCGKCGYILDSGFEHGDVCASCISSPPFFDKACFVFKYGDLSGRIITLFKYADKTYLSELLSNFLVAKINENIDCDDYDFIISVPIGKKRLLKRKYNQAAMLVNRIAQITGVAANNNILYRRKEVPPQTGMRRKQRLKNVKGVFAVSDKYKKSLDGARVILVDDVYTTGATLNECAKVLKSCSVEEVFVVTLARTFLD